MNSHLKRRNFLQMFLGSIFLSTQGSIESLQRHYFSTTNGDFEKLQALISDMSKPARWIFTGDSITQGAKHTLGYRSYSEIFSERIRFEMNRSRDIIINTAISGHVTVDILNDFEWRINQFNPHVVSLMIGTNDAADSRKIAVEVFEQNLLMLIQKIQNANAIPILHTPNTITCEGSGKQRSRLAQYVNTVRKVALKMNVMLVDHWKFWEVNEKRRNSEHWLADPLHPGGRGHLELAREFFRTIKICDNQSFTCIGKINF